MTDTSIQKDLQESFARPARHRRDAAVAPALIERLTLNPAAAQALDDGARGMQAVGGPDAPGAALMALHAAAAVRQALFADEAEVVGRYDRGLLAAIIFEGLPSHGPVSLPDVLPNADRLKDDADVLYLGSRSQVVLAVLNEAAFAYDVENGGRILRLVANFQGGGVAPLSGETRTKARLLRSSHHGGLLAPHSEGPYYSTQRVVGGHSPAASSLVLTAKYNPMAESTAILPTRPIVSHLANFQLLALAQPYYEFLVSDSYAPGTERPEATSLVEVDHNGEFALRYNAERVRCRDDAPPVAHAALKALHEAIAKARPNRVALTPSTVLVLNNLQTVHARDPIADNRRLLIRLFGMRVQVPVRVVRQQPLLIAG